MVSCHPVPRPVIHRDLQPESVSSSDCAKVMHCPFLKEFLRWKAVEPCKTRTGIVDLLDTWIFIFWCCFLNYGTVSKFLYQTGRFSFKSFGIFSFFPGLGGRHFQRRGQLHSHRHSDIQRFPCDFSATSETIPGLKAWVTCFGLQEGMWGLVKGSEFVLWCFFCNNSLQSWRSFCASTFPWNMN